METRHIGDQDLIRQACATAGRQLNTQEWSEYIGTDYQPEALACALDWFDAPTLGGQNTQDRTHLDLKLRTYPATTSSAATSTPALSTIPAPLAPSPPASAQIRQVAAFVTPSKNISCGNNAQATGVMCYISQHEFTVDRAATDQSNNPCGYSAVTLTLPTSGQPEISTCAPDYIVRATREPEPRSCPTILPSKSVVSFAQ